MKFPSSQDMSDLESMDKKNGDFTYLPKLHACVNSEPPDRGRCVYILHDSEEDPDNKFCGDLVFGINDKKTIYI